MYLPHLLHKLDTLDFHNLDTSSHLTFNKDFDAYYRQIIKNYRTVALDDPARIDAYLYRAMAYKDIQEYTKALEMVDYIALLQPDNADLHTIKAVIYTEMGLEKEAQAEKLLAKSGKSILHLD